MHHEAFQFVRRVLEQEQIVPGDVVEFGSYNVNGSIRPLFAAARSYTGVDVRPGPGVDVVSRAQDYDAPDSADLVVCCEVLEHETDPGGVIAAAGRVLRAGGVLILTAAGEGRAPHGVDGGDVGDEPYANITAADLATWLDDWARYHIEGDPVAHDIYAVAHK